MLASPAAKATDGEVRTDAAMRTARVLVANS